MQKEIKRIETELKEQNDFLNHILRSVDDIKHGRVKKFDFSK